VSLVRRQLVGGPADGKIVQVIEGSGYRSVDAPAYVTDTFTFERHIEDRSVLYTQAAAPTGERVLLAPGACWPDRFDTEAWCRRISPAREQWTRVAPWVWRGTGCRWDAPESGQLTPHLGLFLEETAEYRIALVERPGQFLTMGTTVPAEYVERREMVLQALAGGPTTEDDIIRRLQADKAHELLPPCPADGCKHKAGVTLIAADVHARPL
jgi:hypothetical protein